MMKRSRLIISVAFLLMMMSCVDRVFFDVPIPQSYSISISGFISDQPGPYEVDVFRTFDIESNESIKAGVTAKSVVISDNEGNSEELQQERSGEYFTSANGFRGKVGASYNVRVELQDGRVYESIPDTLMGGGSLDSAYYAITSDLYVDGVQNTFEIFTDATTEVDLTRTHFMWSNRVTYMAKTKPEDEPYFSQGGVAGQCYRDPADHKCNYKEQCSGLKNIGSEFKPTFIRVKECECCFCWYDEYNDVVVLNDKLTSVNGAYRSVRVDRVALTYWNLMYKLRTEVTLQSLSPQAFAFWKAVRDQHTAVSNIFQPITGKIRGNIVQTAGVEEQAEGLFYSSSISKKEFYIARNDVSEGLIPVNESPHKDDFSCLRLAPNASSMKPGFWIE